MLVVWKQSALILLKYIQVLKSWIVLKCLAWLVHVIVENPLISGKLSTQTNWVVHSDSPSLPHRHCGHHWVQRTPASQLFSDWHRGPNGASTADAAYQLSSELGLWARQTIIYFYKAFVYDQSIFTVCRGSISKFNAVCFPFCSLPGGSHFSLSVSLCCPLPQKGWPYFSAPSSLQFKPCFFS